MEAVRTRERERGRDGGGIYVGAAGPCEGGRSIGPVAECRGNQPLITPAVVFTLLRASARLHSFAPEFALSPHQLHRSSLQPLPPAPSFCSRRCSTTTLSPPPPSPPTQPLSPFSHYFNSLSLWQSEMEPFCWRCISWPSPMQTPPLCKHSRSASVCNYYVHS